MIAIIDYDTGNLRSVCNALDRIGAEYVLTDDPKVIVKADRVLLPGVGEASSAMHKLQERGLCEVIKGLQVPVLGICIGMQLMCRHSEEGDVDCLGIFDADVLKFQAAPSEGVKVPHMGWNAITGLETGLFDGLSDGDFVYFVHSYILCIRLPLLCVMTLSRFPRTAVSFLRRCIVAISMERSFIPKRAVKQVKGY